VVSDLAMSIVSNNIKYLRRLNGLTQEQFARKIGIKRSLLGAYEESRANPNLVNLKNMASAFGVSVDNLLKNDLRRIKETPNLGSFQSNPAKPAPSSPLMSDPGPVQTPKPIAEILDNYQTPPPAPLRMVARPVALKNVYNNPLAPPIKEPVYQASSTQQSNNYVQEKEEIFQQEASFVAPAPAVEQPKESLPLAGIPLITKASTAEYLRIGRTPSFLRSLETIRIPNLPQGRYHAFEAGDDFPFPGSVLVASFVSNSSELVDGAHYLLTIPQQGLVYRRVYNQIKSKGLLLLSSDLHGIPTTEVPVRDVTEIWAIKAFISYEIPTAPPVNERIKQLVNELQQELEGNRSF
jgi:transcriptional regulator with XRE-family HTH domain